MKRPWRKHLNAEERRELEWLELRAGVLDTVRRDINERTRAGSSPLNAAGRHEMRRDIIERRRDVTAQLNRLRNRGNGRARIAAGDINKGRKRGEHQGAKA